MSDSTEDDDSPPQEDNGRPLWTGLLFPLILARPPLSPEAAGIDPGIVNMNVRGPFPAGQCIQIGKSDGSTLDNFYCHNDLDIAWPEDSISIYRSSDVPVTNGVVEGSNAPTGICVMFEGSATGVSNGRIENVEARYC